MPDQLRAAIVLFASLLDERQRRLYAGLESLKCGWGGDARIAGLLGIDPGTVARGRKQLLAQDIERERVRRPGGGRPPLEKKLPRWSPPSKRPCSTMSPAIPSPVSAGPAAPPRRSQQNSPPSTSRSVPGPSPASSRISTTGCASTTSASRQDPAQTATRAASEAATFCRAARCAIPRLVRAAGGGRQASATSKAVRLRVARLNSTPIR